MKFIFLLFNTGIQYEKIVGCYDTLELAKRAALYECERALMSQAGEWIDTNNNYWVLTGKINDIPCIQLSIFKHLLVTQ